MKYLPRLLLLAVIGCSPMPDLLRVGHLDPSPDESEYRSLKLSLDTLDQDEANWPLNKRVAVVHAPTGKSLEELHAQAVRVAAVNRPLILLGGIRIAEAANIGDAAQADSILAFSGAGCSGTKPNPYLFCLGISPARQAKSLVQFAAEKGSQLLLVTSKHSPEPIEQAIRKEVKTNSKLTLQETVLTDDPASKTALESMLSQTRVLVLCLNAEERSKLVSEALLSKLHEKAVVIFAGEEIDNLTGSGMKNCFTLASYPNTGEEEKKPFVVAYTKAYQTPPDLRASMMHDAFEVAIQLFKRAESVQIKKTAEALLKKDARFDTLTGPIQFHPDGTCSRPHWLVEWKDGGWKSIKKFE